MDFWDFTKLLARRWWVALPLLVMTCALTFSTMTRTKPNYTATAYVVLVPPTGSRDQPGEPTQAQRNAWLQQGLVALGNAASVSVLEPTVATDLEAAGLSGSFTVEMNASSALITLTVVAKSEAQANATATELVKRYSDSVKALQGRAPTADQIQATRLGDDQAAIETNGNVKRAAVAVFGAGLLATAGLTVGVDALLRRRARRRLNIDEIGMSSSDVMTPAPPPAPAPAGPSPGKRSGTRSMDQTDGLGGLVPRYVNVPTGDRSGNGSPQSPATISVDEYGPSRARVAGDGEQSAAGSVGPPSEAPSDATVVLPLRMWPSPHSDTNGRP